MHQKRSLEPPPAPRGSRTAPEEGQSSIVSLEQWEEVVESLSVATATLGHALLQVRVSIMAVRSSHQAADITSQVWEELACAAASFGASPCWTS